MTRSGGVLVFQRSGEDSSATLDGAVGGKGSTARGEEIAPFCALPVAGRSGSETCLRRFHLQQGWSG